MWRQLVKSVRELAAFQRMRVGFVADAPRTPKVRRAWSMLGVHGSDVSLLQDLVSSAHRLNELTTHPGWNDLLEAKQYYQHLSDSKTKTPHLTEHERFQAAVEWATLEGFFKEVYGRIRRGREAEWKLQKLMTR